MGMNPNSLLARVGLVLTGRGGRFGAIVMLMIGLVLIVAGVLLFMLLVQMVDYARSRGIGALGVALAICVAGLVCVALGVGQLFGSHSRLRAAMADFDGAAIKPRADARAVARGEPLPFWVCSECRVVERGLSACCLRCGKGVSFVQATDEEERKIAVTSLG